MMMERWRGFTENIKRDWIWFTLLWKCFFKTHSLCLDRIKCPGLILIFALCCLVLNLFNNWQSSYILKMPGRDGGGRMLFILEANRPSKQQIEGPYNLRRIEPDFQDLRWFVTIWLLNYFNNGPIISFTVLNKWPKASVSFENLLVLE